jgi:hypothetical protein
MAAAEVNQSPNRGQGDCAVTLFNIISSDGKSSKEVNERLWNTITFTESMGISPMDSQVLSGEVVIIDAVSFMSEFSLNGDEIVEFTFATPQKNEINFIGRIYEVYPFGGDDKRALGIKFCSGEKFMSELTVVKNIYKNMLYSDMVLEIFSKFNEVDEKKIYTEETKTLQSATINRHPIDAINWLCGRAKSAKYDGSNYVFFEQADGIFQFVSIESLVDPEERKPTMTYYYDSPPENRVSTLNLISIKEPPQIINVPNVLTNVRGGMYSGLLVTNDLMKRKNEYHVWNYDETYDIYKSVNYNTVEGKGKTSLMNNEKYSKMHGSFTYLAPKHYNMFDESPMENMVEDTVLVRNSQMRQINNIKLEITVPGDSQRRVGELVELVLPALESKSITSGKKDDSIFSGTYLVSKVKHIISATNYDTIIQLVSDSYPEPLPEMA